MATKVRPSELNLNGRVRELEPIEGIELSSCRNTRPDATSHTLIEFPSLAMDASSLPSELKAIWICGEVIPA